MSFSSLRSSSLLYILNREGVPSVNVGTIVNVSAPTPKWGAMAFGQQPEMLVDISVKVDDKQGSFPKVPANLDVWEYEQNGVKTPYILAASKEAINAEINSLRQQALSVINSVDYNRQVVKACDDMLQSLNPEYAEKQRQEQEIAELKLRLDTQQNQMAELIALLKDKEGKSAKECKENAKEEKPSKNK